MCEFFVGRHVTLGFYNAYIAVGGQLYVAFASHNDSRDAESTGFSNQCAGYFAGERLCVETPFAGYKAVGLLVIIENAG